MDKVVNLDKMEFRYWIDELPELEVNNTHEKVIEVKNTNEALNDTLQVALELSLHKHISSYAMLGFDYIPIRGSKVLTVRISYCDENNINYLSQVRPGKSCRYIFGGIDKFFLAAIEDKIIHFTRENHLPAGDLNFNIGANCEVASSPLIFGIITEILLGILITIDKKKLLDSNYIENLFTQTILDSEIFI